VRSPIPSQPDLLIQLRRTQHAVRTRLETELANTGLTTPQYTVLAALERDEELSSSDLAREFGMSAQTVNVLVKALEDCGMVRRARHPEHGRILLLTLTPGGRRALQKGRKRALEIEERLLAQVPPADRTRLMRLLKTIEQTSSAPEGSRRQTAG
jgi:DNA-binding MarR family transcriptional regulator